MVCCKGCGSDSFIKNGIVRGVQRYKCRSCLLNFVEGDLRKKPQTAVKKALCVMLYSLGKASFSMLGRILGHSPSIIYRWLVEAMNKTQEPIISSDIMEMEFDEMWHFIGSKKTSFGSSRRLIVAQGELLHGLQAIVILQHSKSSTTK
ncbi:hypothetical protein [Candidatus Lariskella endosymbiont of Epinotia ramella]|uniref:IS1/IS1595 family N-terminal zinc-binding domain-containing protein n=1 Tax=Candidatus Lariskella endosymbiont of Epinotia ramella TaxID=3066224 RepID=UPI0030D1D3C5